MNGARSEMSIGIYASTGITFLHTFISTQELTLIYLDGQSASLTYTGTLDSQTALLRGHVESNPGDDFIYNETNRGRELCRWAKELGIDGFVRMNAGFETLICNFSTSSLIEAIDVNITVPGRGAAVEDPRLPQDPNRRPPYGIGNDYGQQSSWEWIRSGTWHYGGYANGGQGHREQRVHLDMCGMVTFYDPRLTSLRGAHHGGIRGNDTYENGWGLRKGHRLLDISIEDSRKTIDWVKTTLRRHRSGSLSLEKLRPTSSKCSGINWQAMAETIVDQHKSRTEEIAGVLRQYHGGGLSNSEIVKRVHELSHAIIYPYLQYPTSNKTSPATVQQITTDRCSSIYTSHIREGTYNDFEGLLKDSIKIVLTRLCIWEWEIWQWTEGLTTDLLRSPNFGIDGSTSGRSSSSVDAEILEFESKTRDLLKWLGWDLWSDCDSRCSWDVSTTSLVHTGRGPCIYYSTALWKLTHPILRNFVTYRCGLLSMHLAVIREESTLEAFLKEKNYVNFGSQNA